MRLTKTVIPGLIILAIALAGCGGGGDGGSGNPIASGLAFVPKDSPFVVAIDTDVDGDQYKAIGELMDKFPLGEGLVDTLKRKLAPESGDLSYEDDVRPLLGNPFVVSAIDAASFADRTVENDFVGALDTGDGDKLRDALEKSGAKESAERSGATIFEQNGDTFAVKGDTLIVAGNEELLDQALARADGGDHLSEDQFDAALSDLPDEALLRVYVDVQGLLAIPAAADARKVEWVNALRTLGLTATAAADKVDVDFDLAAEGDLTDADLPIAPGAASPGVIDQAGEVNIGIRDLGQLVQFGEAAAQAVNPAGFGQYEQAKRRIEKQLHVSVDDDLIAQLSGNVSLNLAVNGTFGARAELKDPAAFKRTLAKIADLLPKIAKGAGAGTVGLAKPKPGEDFYALAQPDGDNVVFGVVDDVFVIANDPARAGRLATADPQQVDGAKGALVLKADARELANQILGQLGDRLPRGGAIGGRLFTGPLGDLAGSVESSTDGLKGHFSLAVD